MYSHNGEQVDPRDVLDDQEYADYKRSQRQRPRRMAERGPEPTRIDELGYDQNGQWHPDYDPWETR